MAERFEIRADGSWEYIGEDSLLHDPERNAIPNFRLYNPLTRRYEYRTVYRVYCRNCGADGGICARNSSGIQYICNECIELPHVRLRYAPMLPVDEYLWRNGLPARKE